MYTSVYIVYRTYLLNDSMYNMGGKNMLRVLATLGLHSAERTKKSKGKKKASNLSSIHKTFVSVTNCTNPMVQGVQTDINICVRLVWKGAVRVCINLTNSMPQPVID